MLGTRLHEAIKNSGLSVDDIANYIGISTSNLYKLYKKDSFEVSYLRKAAEILKLPLSHFLDEDFPHIPAAITQTGDNNQAGSGNTQKIKTTTKAPTHELALQLDTCQRELAMAYQLISSKDATIAAKDETINLLRGGYNRPN